ncbi:hypothetical protein PAXRUDRAFT_18035 [Paxillus rubicundulus Ve08.2h10]|uniref:Uncharacterized protein n=1 Tax=Paxillus rubicundulus Ve08.2h10 TaxID=930991 RepID=A0A0D0C023_9AGAM|nr:hypothetical protein PAXRUDRAFT_18035 [Paxillus rubicundulus Ve08.2h10]
MLGGGGCLSGLGGGGVESGTAYVWRTSSPLSFSELGAALPLALSSLSPFPPVPLTSLLMSHVFPVHGVPAGFVGSALFAFGFTVSAAVPLMVLWGMVSMVPSPSPVTATTLSPVLPASALSTLPFDFTPFARLAARSDLQHVLSRGSLTLAFLDLFSAFLAARFGS